MDGHGVTSGVFQGYLPSHNVINLIKVSVQLNWDKINGMVWYESTQHVTPISLQSVIRVYYKVYIIVGFLFFDDI